MAEHTGGLREQKRQATRRAIQVAAVEAVESLGLAKATVQLISRTADVAPRTFFNHFPSKEAALMGEPWRPLTPAIANAFVAGTAAVFDDLATLLVSIVNTGTLDRDLARRRHALAEVHPDLAGRRLAWLTELEADLRPVLARRLAIERTRPEHGDQELEARLLAAVAVVTFRSAWSWWLDRGTEDSLADDIVRSFAVLDLRSR